MHALIIEMDMWVVLAIEDVLSTLGYTSFDSATSPSEAEQLAAHHSPDLITSAVHIGNGCGFDAVRAARAGRLIPVVFITSTAWVARERERDIAVVQKPFSAVGLTKAVESAVASMLTAAP